MCSPSERSRARRSRAREGGFVTDDNGQVVVPQVDISGLQRLAAAGGGRYAALTTTDRDLDALFPRGALPLGATLEASVDGGGEEQYEADIWLDRGAVLAALMLPLLALCFRRGWIVVWALVVLVPLPRAQALEWQDFWQRPDQRGLKAFESEQPERAAELFENPEWRSAAQYRAGKFEDSAASLSSIDSTEGHYNRGNALAKAGQLPAAIAEYDRTLELDPEHEDARYNRDLLQQYLQDHPEQQQQQDQGEGQPGQPGESGTRRTRAPTSRRTARAATSSRASRATKARAATVKPTKAPTINRTSPTKASRRATRIRAGPQRGRAGGRRAHGGPAGPRRRREMGVGAGG